MSREHIKKVFGLNDRKTYVICEFKNRLPDEVIEHLKALSSLQVLESAFLYASNRVYGITAIISICRNCIKVTRQALDFIPAQNILNEKEFVSKLQRLEGLLNVH